VPSALPDGEPVPTDGALPPGAFVSSADRDLGIYLHVPFCTTRCGYCDFNTYTAEELGPGASRADYLVSASRELALAREVLGAHARPISTVFVGGGTPTLLPPSSLNGFLAAIDREFGLAPDAEVSIESNPESVDAMDLQELRDGGFTRISFGMQSAQPRVLASLDRRHTPGRVLAAVEEARAAGFGHINLDLIYGAPGETDDDWQTSLDAAVAAGPDHVSAYALIVEDGTRLGAQVGRGEVHVADDDTLAHRYVMADETLAANGLSWYEVSNWALPSGDCRHNLAYWSSQDWWGIGPGAHSHVGGVRWWNVKHPAAYAQRLAAGESPAAAREVLTDDEQYDEKVLLGLRLSQGLPVSGLSETAVRRATVAATEGLLDADALVRGQAVLTLKGRLLADRLAVELLTV
jgi:putative oxygen-independent coproporphyrinogen III oxidase